MNEIEDKRPVICPKCGSKEIAIITDYHKCIWMKVITNCVIVAIIISFTFELTKLNKGEFDYTIIVGLMIVYIALSIIIYFTESKTHAKAICRDCGHIWLLD